MVRPITRANLTWIKRHRSMNAEELAASPKVLLAKHRLHAGNTARLSQMSDTFREALLPQALLAAYSQRLFC